jgi:GTP-binding protein LepA
MNGDYIRNFSIIAHIDHGKSTLADRLLEATHTIERRVMKAQVLDSMDIERERGITIKMQPVRMRYAHADGETYVLNLIDTPGHIDFSYEVSRALTAVEGVLLLVDATQGVQAQTLSTLSMARAQGCVVIPVLSKIDMPHASIDEVSEKIATLLSIDPSDIIHTSGKTGEGVDTLLAAIVERVPPPKKSEGKEARALTFDFSFGSHRGITAFVRVFDGSIKKGDTLKLCAADVSFKAQEVGFFSPRETPCEELPAGSIGYIVTGVKEAGVVLVGDTVSGMPHMLAPLSGYEEPRPVVWASLYPESQDDLTFLRQALSRLKLSDSSLTFEEESSGVLGRGFRCGFLGMLHLEVVTERLRREFSLKFTITLPSITYEVTTKKHETLTVYTPSKFPEFGMVESVREPWVSFQIITTYNTMSSILTLLHDHEAEVTETETFGDGRVELKGEMPLRELMRQFFDKMKSVSSGYASLSYAPLSMRSADVVRLDILVAEELVPAFTRVVSRRRVQEEGEAMVEKLHAILPKQLFVVKIQAQALGRIISSKSISAMRKDVTGYLYGGDVSRKKKLLEKQKKGKARRAAHSKMEIPEDVFMKMVRGDG